jgi:hypothetical protein
MHRGGAISWSVPPSGLVTALEPILRACDGTWIASGTGDADRETVDERGHLRVPPDNPEYTLRRVWLGKEEEEGFYFGFANEGLWPLCHIAHTRPIFRSSDWQSYQDVNRKFADAVCWPKWRGSNRAVLVQDYHFALLPRMIKEAPPRRAHCDLLAHSLAESGGFPHLPLAARTARRPAGRRYRRFSHPGALQQFPGDRGRRARIADRMGTLRGEPAGHLTSVQTLPDQRGFHENGRGRSAIRARAGCSANSA